MREPRAKSERPATPEHPHRSAADDVRRTLAHLAEVERLAQIGSWEWDIANDVVTWSAELYRMLGMEPTRLDASLECALDLAHPEDRALVRDVMERAPCGRRVA